MLGQTPSPTAGLKSYTFRKSLEFPTPTNCQESCETGVDALHGYAPSRPCNQEGADGRRIARRVLNTKLKDRAPSPSATYQVDQLRPNCDSCKSRNIDRPASSSQAKHGDCHPPGPTFQETACTEVMQLPDHNDLQWQSHVNTLSQPGPNSRCTQLGSPKLRIPNKRYIIQTIRPFPGQRAEGKRSKTIIVTRDPDIHHYTNKENSSKLDFSQRDPSNQTLVEYRKDNFDNFRPSNRERNQNDISRALSDAYRVKSSSLSHLLAYDSDGLNLAGDDGRQAPDKKISTNHFKSFSNKQTTGRLTRDTFAQVNVPLPLRDISIQENGCSTRRDKCVQVNDDLTHVNTRELSCLTREDNCTPEKKSVTRRETCTGEEGSLKQDKFTQESDGFVQRYLYPREVRVSSNRDTCPQENRGVIQKDKCTQENGSFAQKNKYTQESCGPIRQSEVNPQEICSVCLKSISDEKNCLSTFNKTYIEETKDLTTQKSSPPPDCPCRLQKMNMPENDPIAPPAVYRPENATIPSHIAYGPENAPIPPQTMYRTDNAPFPPQQMYRPEEYQFPPQTMHRQESRSMPQKDISCPKHLPLSPNGIHSPRECPVSPQEMYYPEHHAVPPPNMFYQEQSALSPQNMFYPENQASSPQLMQGVNDYFNSALDVTNQEYRPHYQQSPSAWDQSIPLFQKEFNQADPNNQYSKGYSVRHVPQNRKDYDPCQRCEADGSVQNMCQNVCSPHGAFKKYSEMQVAKSVNINSYRNENIPLREENITYGNKVVPQVISSQTRIVQARTVSHVGTSPVHPQSNETIIRAVGSTIGRGRAERISQVELTQHTPTERFSRAESPQNLRPKSERSTNVSNSKFQIPQSENATRAGSPKVHALQSERLLRVKCTPGQSPKSENYSRASEVQGQASQSNRSLRTKNSYGPQQSERSLRVKGSLSPVAQNEKITRVTSTQSDAFQNENIRRDVINQVQAPTNRFENNEYLYQSPCQGMPCANQQFETLPGSSRSECVEACCRRLVLEDKDVVPDKYCRDRCQNFSSAGLAENGQYQPDRLEMDGYTNSNAQQADSAHRVSYNQGGAPSNEPGYSASKSKTDLRSDNINQYGFNNTQYDSNSDPNRLTRQPEYMNSGLPPSERQRLVDYAETSSTQGQGAMPDGYTNVVPEQGYFQTQYNQPPYPAGYVGYNPINSANNTQFNRNEPQISRSFRANQREYIQEGNPQSRWTPRCQSSESRSLPQCGYNNVAIQSHQKNRMPGIYEPRYCEDGGCNLHTNYSNPPSPTLSWSNQIQGKVGNRQNEQNYQTCMMSCVPECGTSSRMDNNNKTCETSYIIKTVTKGTCHNDDCRIEPKCEWGCQNKEVQKTSRATSPTQEIDRSQNRQSSSRLTIKIKAGGKGQNKVSETWQERPHGDNNNAKAQQSNQPTNSTRDHREKKGGPRWSSGATESSSSCTLIANPSCVTLHSSDLSQETAANIVIHPINRSHGVCLEQEVIKICSKKKR